MKSLSIDELETEIGKLNISSLRAVGRAAGVEKVAVLRVSELRAAILSIAKGETDPLSGKEELLNEADIAAREVAENVLALWEENRKDK